jgi:acetylornithine deacetylase/succinyl-diaminopimelate desuccinylase-like protein
MRMQLRAYTMSTQAYFAEHAARHLDEFFDLLRIPSISSDPAYIPDVARAGLWIADRLSAIGVPEVKLIDASRHPLVEARWTVDPQKKTLLVYGHYDVQPVEPLDLWESPPFEPTVREGKIYARGSADMKASLITFVQALEAIVAEHGEPPLNLIMLFEGEEESGGEVVTEYLQANPDRLACDAIINLDGAFPAIDQPGFGVTLKGGMLVELHIRTGETDLHSGGYGAAVPNANQIMAKLAATFHTPEGAVAIEGFYDDVVPLSDADRAEIAASAAVMQPILEESGAFAEWGEPGYTAAERAGARPALDINGVWGGFTGEGAKTVTPAEAHMKLSCRMVPDQDGRRLYDLIVAHIRKHIPPGIKWEANYLGGSPAYSTPRDTWALQVAASTLADIYGKSPVFYRVGGSVPITLKFKQTLGVETVTFGFTMPGSRIHAPNEWFRLEDFPMAQRTYVELLQAFGDA